MDTGTSQRTQAFDLSLETVYYEDKAKLGTKGDVGQIGKP